MIDEFAARFGQHPDTVFDNTSFGTIAYFHEKWKEEAEYRERYSYIWNEISTPPPKK